MSIMNGGSETTREEEVIFDYDNYEILYKLYRKLGCDDRGNEYDRRMQTHIEDAVWAIVKRYV